MKNNENASEIVDGNPYSPKKISYRLGFFYGSVTDLFDKKKHELTKPFEIFQKMQEYLGEKYGTWFQLFDPTSILAKTQVDIILNYVSDVFSQNLNISSSPSMEFLLYLAQSRQISVALEEKGIPFKKELEKERKIGIIIVEGSKPSFSHSLEESRLWIDENMSKIEWDDFPFLDCSKFEEFIQINDISIDTCKTIMMTEGNQKVGNIPINDERWRPYLIKTYNLNTVRLFLENYKKQPKYSH